MSRSSPILKAPDFPETGEVAAAFLFKQIDSIQAIKVLSRLTRAVQKHRGASIAYINGEARFLPLAESLQEQVQKLFYLLCDIESRQPLFPPEPLQGAFGDWRAIEEGWQQDTVINNYEFHCHLVDTLSRLAQDIVSKWILASPEVKQDAELGQGVTALLFGIPEHIELLAKLRGLTTHAAFSGRCDHDSHIRISFLGKKITSDYQRLYRSLSRLKGAFSTLSGIHAVPAQRLNLEFLLGLIQSNILDAEEIRLDGSRVFDLATEIIDIYWALVEQAIQVIESEMFEHYLLAQESC